VPDLIFLDANVIFSAAYRPANELRQLWSLPDLTLLTSLYAISEVERNLPPTLILTPRTYLQSRIACNR
jgi:hypothetical protein